MRRMTNLLSDSRTGSWRRGKTRRDFHSKCPSEEPPSNQHRNRQSEEHRPWLATRHNLHKQNYRTDDV